MKRVLVIVGTPGVGKSSISGLLASRLDGVHVNLGDLVKNEGLRSGLDEKRQTLIADEEKISRRIQEIIEQSKGYVVVEGHFAVHVVAAGDAFLAFVLRRNPDELQETLRARGFIESKIAENVAAEILDVCLFDAVEAYGEGKVCEIDTSRKTIEDVVDEIVSILEGLKRCRVGVVDWLTALEMQGRLDEFLKTLEVC